MKWRCVNDWMGYCKGPPNFGEKADPREIKETCKSSPKTCRKYLNHSDLNQIEKKVKEE